MSNFKKEDQLVINEDAHLCTEQDKAYIGKTGTVIDTYDTFLGPAVDLEFDDKYVVTVLESSVAVPALQEAA